MSVAEMKLAAINEIIKLDNKKALKEILEHFAKLSTSVNPKTHNLSQHFEEFAERYGKVLEKLA